MRQAPFSPAPISSSFFLSLANRRGTLVARPHCYGAYQRQVTAAPGAGDWTQPELADSGWRARAPSDAIHELVPLCCLQKGMRMRECNSPV